MAPVPVSPNEVGVVYVPVSCRQPGVASAPVLKEVWLQSWSISVKRAWLQCLSVSVKEKDYNGIFAKYQTENTIIFIHHRDQEHNLLLTNHPNLFISLVIIYHLLIRIETQLAIWDQNS